MSDPRRLFDDAGTSPFERALVGSWEGEQPSSSARAKTLAALGLAAAATATTVAAATGSVAPKAAAAGGSIAPKAIAALIAWKWIAGGVLAVGTAILAIGLAARSTTPATVDQPAQVVLSPPQPTFQATTPLPTLATPTTAVPPVKATTAWHASPTTAPASSALAAEVAAMDSARSAIDERDPGRALRLIDDYETRHPHGAFLQEAEVLRVQALTDRGDKAEAARVGKRFLAAYPSSPHAGHVRALIGVANP